MKKFFKALTVFFIVLLILALGLFAFLKITGRKSDPSQVVRYETDNLFITGKTEQIAHRFGAGIAPEETRLALENCLENPDIHTDIYEFDLHLTADDQMVLIHDQTLDRTSDAKAVFGKKGITVREKTLAELRTLNMGANFKAADGSFPYRNSDDPALTILTLPEALDLLVAQGVQRMSIEIKDHGADGMRGVDLLYRELAARQLLETVIFSSFDSDVSAYAQQHYPDLLRSNTDAEAMQLYLAVLFGDEDYVPPCRVFQLPYTPKYLNFGINFASADVLNLLHSHNVAVQFWGGNTEEKMLYLRDMGADGVMTDYPDWMSRLYS